MPQSICNYRKEEPSVTMSGLNQHCQDYYLLPGTYSYPLSTSGTPTASAYLSNYDAMSWLVPDHSMATYVASPLGVINYLSDLQSQMALPTPQNLSSGLFYAVLDPVEQQITLPLPVGMPVPVPRYTRAVYAYRQVEEQPVEQISYYLLALPEEEDTSTEQQQPEDDSAQSDGESAQEEEQAKEPVAEQAAKKGKRTYQAEEGYLVEEPTSSEDDQEETKEESARADTQ